MSGTPSSTRVTNADLFAAIGGLTGAIQALVDLQTPASVPVVEHKAADFSGQVTATPKAPAKRRTRKTTKAKAPKVISGDIAWTGTATDRKRWNNALMASVKLSGIKVPGAGNHGTLYGFVTQEAWDVAKSLREGGKTPAQALDSLVDLANEFATA